jgi:hypothetical protein
MLTLPSAIAERIVPFADLFSERVFEKAKALIAGAILAPGKRTVTSALRIVGKSLDAHFQNYHRLLNRDRWSPMRAGRRLLGLLVETFAPDGTLVFALDETIERRRGERISAKGIYRDPVRSSHSHFVKASGLRWLCLMLVTRVAWARRDWALPVLSVLTPSERFYQTRGRAHVPLLDRAEQIVRVLRRWLPEREIVVAADNTYAAIEWLDAVRRHVHVVTRLRLDAALYEPAPRRRPGQNGRPRKKGARLPTLEAVLAQKRPRWTAVTIEDWYGEGSRTVQIRTGTAVWYHTGKPVVPIRWVLIRDPEGRFRPQALLSTKLDASAEQIVRWFITRWCVEVTFEEARAHLGIETQRQWNDKAIARTTPALLGLYSLVTLMAERLIGTGEISARTAAWYEKTKATFSDTIAFVRRELWRHDSFSMSDTRSDLVKIPRSVLERLTDALCYAA